MVRLFCLIAKKADINFDEFKSYYEEKHAPLVHRLLSKHIWPDSLVRSYFDPADEIVTKFSGGKLPPHMPYNCIVTYDFKDSESAQKFLQVYGMNAQELQADEENFMDRTKVAMYMADDRSQGEQQTIRQSR